MDKRTSKRTLARSESELTADTVCALLHYDPETGIFTRRCVEGVRASVGDVAGCGIVKDGKPSYVRIMVAGCVCYAHRLAFLYMNGALPQRFVDHINGDKRDNRWANLRAATSHDNMRNRTARADSRTGIKGVRLLPDGVYEARISRGDLRLVLGRFTSIDGAAQAYARASRLMDGQFRPAS